MQNERFEEPSDQRGWPGAELDDASVLCDK
jgi:hypothetical protein